MTFTKPSMKRLHACAALLAVISSAPAYADADSPKFTMMVISDTSAGKYILDGSFETAIQKLSAQKGKKRNEFAVHTNTCVAYAKAKQVAKASTACDEALAFAEAQLDALGPGSHARKSRLRQVRSDMTVALSNQGVLLAINGETDRAKDAFDNALQLKSHRKLVRNNIARMNSLPTAEGVPES